jgi:hypothetical protein
MSIQTFEVQDIKCIDDGDGRQGLNFIGTDKLVTLVLDKKKGGHDEKICSLQYAIWNAGHRPYTITIQDLH